MNRATTKYAANDLAEDQRTKAMELDEIREIVDTEKNVVKALLKSILEDESRLGNPFILVSAAKDIYAHAQIIMDAKMAAPVQAEI